MKVSLGKKLAISAALLATTFTYLNIVLPDKPVNDIDTKTLHRDSSGIITTSYPHLPVVDFSWDGRVALRRKGNKGIIPFILIQPEKNGTHFTDHNQVDQGISNVLGDVLKNSNVTYENFENLFKNDFPKESWKLKNFNNGRTFLCENRQRYQNPRVCDDNHDCYNLTVITRYGKPHPENPELGSYYRLLSTEVMVKVANPKTVNARIVEVKALSNRSKVGPLLGPFPKLAEPVISGNGRLFITRVGRATLKVPELDANLNEIFDSEGKRVLKEIERSNLTYNVYGDNFIPCNVHRWTNKKFRPLAYAPYDKEFNMKERFKFARYPFRDSLGNDIPWDGVIGASYPWIDKDAANIFMTLYGIDDPYYAVDKKGNLKETLFEDRSDFSPTNSDEVTDFEETGARTAGLGIMGFWTHGKLVQIDGLLNNNDYNFKIQGPKLANSFENVVRNFVLYKKANDDLVEEGIGYVRELGGSNTSIKNYQADISQNSSFIGSIENRLNASPSMKPALPRDIVWNFTTTRHTEEVAFDDFMNPHIIINAEMVGAVGYVDARPVLRHYDGNKKGSLVELPTSEELVDNKPQLATHPLLFQNSASSIPGFQKNPAYGIPIGSKEDIRLEPVAKGGVHGKGVWLMNNTGIKFDIPAQDASTHHRSIDNLRTFYYGVHIDPRESSIGVNHERLLFSIDTRGKVFLTKTKESKNFLFNKIVIKDNDLVEKYSIVLPDSLAIKRKQWKHIGVQIKFHHEPIVYINGYRLGYMNVHNGGATGTLKIKGGNSIYLGHNNDSTREMGLKGWFDDFMVIASNPSPEEKCNFARGTLVEINQGATGLYAARANNYPSLSHKEIEHMITKGIVKESYFRGITDASWFTNFSSTGKKYACFQRTNFDSMKEPGSKVVVASLNNLPKYTTSIRDQMTHGFNKLRHGQVRPDFSANKFCLSCHVQEAGVGSSYISFPEMDKRSLLGGTVESQLDGRRQPSQPPQRIYGNIPKDHFGVGNPASNYKINPNSPQSYIDYWLLRD